MNILYVFPGQGSQYEGMGKDICEAHEVARAVYDRANEVLGYDIKDMSFNNPGDELNLTRNTQPALLTHHIACLDVFKEKTGGSVQPTMAAGHSLGEYSALVAANALTFETALKLVQKRGELMGEHGEGEMTAFMMRFSRWPSSSNVQSRHATSRSRPSLEVRPMTWRHWKRMLQRRFRANARYA